MREMREEYWQDDDGRKKGVAKPESSSIEHIYG